MRLIAFVFVFAGYVQASGLSPFHVDYATFLGGSLDENPAGISVDSFGNVYVVGTTISSDFPLTSSLLGSAFGGHSCAFVTKLNAAGSGVVWSVCLGNAPGELISIFGSGFTVNTNVFFDGVAAPVLYVQSSQINAVVPFGVNGPATAITFQASQGQIFGPAKMNVFPAVPALFTASGTGKGQAAILNQDGSMNSTKNPAARGSVISIFMTGAGRMNPAQSDGSITTLSGPFPIVALGVGCSVGQLLYAGAAPGLVAGVVQVNVQLSTTTATGNVPILIYIGNYASGLSGDTTVAVR